MGGGAPAAVTSAGGRAPRFERAVTACAMNAREVTARPPVFERDVTACAVNAREVTARRSRRGRRAVERPGRLSTR